MDLLVRVGSPVVADVGWETSPSARNTINGDLAVHGCLLVAKIGWRDATRGDGVGGAIDPLPIIISTRKKHGRRGIITEGMYAAGWKFDVVAMKGVVMIKR